jgi:2-keto-4-pentenoate hydratase/2-oxohepta-3-ene-1,7-dioic acid hydratase in catechol pathway
MKIICLAKNYGAHAVEMSSQEEAAARQRSAVISPDAKMSLANIGENHENKPVWFLKPDSALLLKNQPFFYPDFSNEIDYELEVVVRIDKVGKSVEPRFAHKYYSEVALGIDFTARDLQRQAKAKGQPWSQSKGFDGSAALSPFVPLCEVGGDICDLDFALTLNGKEVQHGNTRDMLTSVDDTIAYISHYMLLRTGDLIYTGTPSGVGAVQVGDVLEGTLQGRPLLTCKIK